MKPGDVVQLKSGGRPVTVEVVGPHPNPYEGVGAGCIRVRWMSEKGAMEQATLPVVMFQEVTPPEPVDAIRATA